MPPNICLVHSSLAHLQITLIPQGHNTDNFIIGGCTRCCLLTTLDATSDDKIVHYSDVINEHDGISIHQHLNCLLNCLFWHRSKEISKLRVTGLCEGIHWWPVDSPHKVPVTRKMFSFDDVIMVVMVTWDIGLLETAFGGQFGWLWNWKTA